jgi:hypothetical protein
VFPFGTARVKGMIRKSGNRFSEKIMPQANKVASSVGVVFMGNHGQACPENQIWAKAHRAQQ